MPLKEYVPQIERKVILNHGVTQSEVLLSDIRILKDRFAEIGKTLCELREAPRRYNSLFPYVQRLYLDLFAAVSLLHQFAELTAAQLEDHEHEFTVRMTSGPPRF